MSPSISENLAFQALSLAVAGIYCLMLHSFRSQVRVCLKGLVNLSASDLAQMENRSTYDRFSAIAMGLGALSLGLGAVKVAATGGVAAAIAAGGELWLPAVATIGIAAVAVATALVQAGVVRIAGALTLSGKFVVRVVQIKKNHLSALSLLLVPIVTVWTGENPVRDTVTAYLFAAAIITIAVSMTVHTLGAFIKQKVSVLVWFLYLCTVESFPVCALVLAATRNV
jgi:hypothetical protein